jgi:hypothetical protein
LTQARELHQELTVIRAITDLERHPVQRKVVASLQYAERL